MDLERPLLPPVRRGEVWLGILLLALALPLLAHDLAWVMRHWNSVWILNAVFSVLRHA